MLNQDLHIHTNWSDGDSLVVPEMTVSLVASLHHAQTVGISDHLEFIHERFDAYAAEVAGAGLLVGTEVNGADWAAAALEVDCDYRIYHCWNRDADYAAIDALLADGKPLIIAHPHALDTDLNRVPSDCLVEINNRYIWRGDWLHYYQPFRNRFRFVLSSDAHQPHWLNQSVAARIAAQLAIPETLLFSDKQTAS